MTEVKETKAQKVERLKREKLAWDHLDEIREFARQGRDLIPPEWTGTYFRSWGIYTQGDGLGVVGGKNGEGNATQYFMVRIRIPNGLLTSEQTRVIANLSEEYGRGVADITTRQNIQLHWVTIENIPNLMERLQAVGLTTTGACGDVARNVTGCPVAGIDGHELIDASPFALAIDKDLGGNREFYNLPRKFKMTVTGCSSWCSYPEINDVAFTATTRFRNGAKEIGFTVRIGGGLSTEPHLAVKLNAFVQQGQVVAVARGVANIFKASEVLRQSRDKARLKYLFLQHGWTAENFLAELESQIGFKLDPAETEEIPADIHRDHLGIHRQKQPGLSYVGASDRRTSSQNWKAKSASSSIPRKRKRFRLTFIATILVSTGKSNLAFPMWELRCCAGALPRLSCAKLPSLQTGMAMVTSAILFSRTFSLSTFPMLLPITLQANSVSPACQWPSPHLHAAQSLAQVPNFASLLSLKQRSLRAGYPANWKSAFPLSKNKSSYTLLAAQTAAASTG